MQISVSSNGFAFLASVQSKEEVGYLKAARWAFHPSPAYCNLYKDGGKSCPACQWGIPPSTWYCASQGCGSPQHPVSLFTKVMDRSAVELYKRTALTSVMSRAESSTLLVPAPEGKKYLPFQLAGIEFALQRQHTLIADEPGLGKAQPLDAKVLTPTGWKTMGELAVGDRVMGRDGLPHQVTGVFDRGERPVFRVLFSDGASTECCDEHLWQVNSSLRKFQGLPPRVYPLSEIRKRLHNGWKNLHFIPVAEPLRFSEEESKLVIDPYLLGLLLGDGGIAHQVMISSADKEIIESVKALIPAEHRVSHSSKYDYRICGPTRKTGANKIRNELKNLRLFGKKSESKFVPHAYKFASPSQRLALLQGLLDTDGYVCPGTCSIEYSTVSKQLAEDVKFLVQSLAGTCRVSEKRAREKAQKAYRIRVSLPQGVEPFRLSRKSGAHVQRSKYVPSRSIVSVTPAGVKATRCISVDAPDHLYLTDDLIATHNTIQAIGFVNATRPQNVLIVCPASLRRNWQRELDRWLVDPVGTKVFVVSYEQAKTEYEALVKVPWGVLVLDEAHYLKNERAARTKIIFGSDDYTTPKMMHGRQIGGHTHKKGIFESATRVLALTGTPIANRPKDAWTIVHALAPSIFPKYLDFAKRYCDAKSEVIKTKATNGRKGGLKTVWKFDGQSNLPELGAKLRASIMIRREKMAVLKDLPEKTRQILPLDLKSAKAHSSFDRRVGKLIGEKLRQAEGRGDFKAFGAMIQQVIPFDEMARVRKQIGLEKLPAVMAFLDERLCLDRERSKFESEEKLVVFAHHREVLSTIKTAYGRHCVVFWGGMSDNQRAAAVDAFQNDPEVRVFAGQIQASGTGLTLTASSTVVFAELDWVPANLVQAEDRIHRIGQKQSALAIYLVVDGSLEARMAYLLAEKDEVIRTALR